MKTSTSTFIFSILAAALPLVSAHGLVADMSIDGKAIKGSLVGGPGGSAPIDTPIRQVTTQNPIKGAKNPNVNCGSGATPASQVADANPGSNLTFSWKTASSTNWPHNTGPIMTYMTNCGNTTCDKFDPSNAEWFKISEVGKKDANTWVQADLMTGATANVQLPPNIAPGNYMIRHEIIALHLATAMGGAEFYVGCSQVRIGGSGTGVPSQDELVKLPGAYSDNDPGIFVPDVFNPGFQYTFPGPPVSKLAANSSSSPSGNSGSKGQCRLKSNSKSKRSVQPNAYRPRTISRIMRDLIFH